MLTRAELPFNSALLDSLMDRAGIDVLLATSKHNVQYLLGGHRSFFFDYMDAAGLSRYLPILLYPKGAPENAAYIGHRLEATQFEIKPVWTPQIFNKDSGTLDAMTRAVEHIRKLKPRKVGVELAFLPADAYALLKSSFPEMEISDALFTLERLRARKSPEELSLLKIASDNVIDAMLAVIEGHGPGATKQELADALRREETNRGLTFEYCLVATGTSHKRAPSPETWENGQIMSLDSGGNYHGYIGDLCRMAILGEPDAELIDLLGEIEALQQAAFRAIAPGRPGKDIYAATAPVLARTKHRDVIRFLAHGMGLVTHEAPRLTDKGPVPYDAYDAERPLEAGMVVSVETTLYHKTRGFIKLEDTVAVTPTGHELYGGGYRGWNRGGTKLKP